MTKDLFSMKQQNSKSRILSDFSLIEKLLEKHHIDSNFCVEMMANKLGISVSYLRDVLEKNYEISPHQLIENYRLWKSLKLLERDLKEYQIINRIGYSNTRTFRRAFKKRFGILPSIYRKLTIKDKIRFRSIQIEMMNKRDPSNLFKFFLQFAICPVILSCYF